MFSKSTVRWASIVLMLFVAAPLMAQRRGMGSISAGHFGGMSGGAVFRGSTFRGGMGFNNRFFFSHNSHFFPQQFFLHGSHFHPHSSFSFAFGFPAFGFGYSSFPYYGYGYPYAYYPPAVVTVAPGAGSYDQGGYENGAGRSEVVEPFWLLALKDGSVVLATSYWLEDSTMHYVTREGKHLEVDLSRIDVDLTRKLNEERGLHFQLPRPTASYEPKRYDAYGRVIESGRSTAGFERVALTSR
jgi:hypothetical protein